MNTTGVLYFLLFIAALLAAIAKKLTISGAITGFVVGVCVLNGGGITALIVLAAFFATGTVATFIGSGKKKTLGIAEENKGRRTSGQVLANGGVAATIGLISVALYELINQKSGAIFPMMMAGSLAAATADTLSSELGNVYGQKFYNIISFKKDNRGLDGVISLEGTLAGVLGAMLSAIIYGIGSGDIAGVTFVLFSGTIGTLADSVLGATLERRRWLTNNWVNFLNTLTGAASAGLLYILFK